MEYRRLGRTGLQVSEVCLGTMTFGNGADETESRRMIDRALDVGVNFFDTANSYAGGESEAILGRAIEQRRHACVIATKFGNATGPGPNDSGTSRVHIMQAIEASLRRLRSDYIDVYYVHHVVEEGSLDEMIRALDDLVREGKVRYIGCSNYQAWRLMDALWLSEANGLARFECYQAQYSLVVRDVEPEHVPICRDKRLGLVAWSPLAGGFLSGKYAPGERSKSGTRSEAGFAFPERYFARNADEILAALIEVSGAVGRTPAQTANRWVLDRPEVTSAIIGARTMAQLEDNLGACDWTLESDSRARLDEASRPPARYFETLQRTMEERRAAARGLPQG